MSDRFARELPEDRALSLLPDPEPSELWCPVISVEDHVFESEDLFSRVPESLRERAPRAVKVQGRPAWQVGERRYFTHGMDGSSGRPLAEARAMVVRPEQFRRGVADPDARVADMDLNGVWASVCFPSVNWFSGRAFGNLGNEVGLACVRAYNDWLLEDWCGDRTDRFIPSQVPFLGDPVLGADEVRRNAKRGFRCVGFSENPQGLGFPTLHSSYWDPFFAACVETGTILNLHPGSSETRACTPDAPIAVSTAVFFVNSAIATVDWLFSQIPVRFPDLAIVLSGGGASWVPVIMERIDRAHRLRDESLAVPNQPAPWPDSAPHPLEVLRRNFWFSSNEDPLAFAQLDAIGDDRVMIDTDYPHPESSWPNTQDVLRAELGDLPHETVRKVCFETAAALYRHPLPPTELLGASVMGAADTRTGGAHASRTR